MTFSCIGRKQYHLHHPITKQRSRRLNGCKEITETGWLINPHPVFFFTDPNNNHSPAQPSNHVAGYCQS